MFKMILSGPNGDTVVIPEGEYLYRCTDSTEDTEKLLKENGILFSVGSWVPQYAYDKAKANNSEPLFLRFPTEGLTKDNFEWTSNSPQLKGNLKYEVFSEEEAMEIRPQDFLKVQALTTTEEKFLRKAMETEMDMAQFSYDIEKCINEGLLNENELNEADKKLLNHQRRVTELAKKLTVLPGSSN